MEKKKCIRINEVKQSAHFKYNQEGWAIISYQPHLNEDFKGEVRVSPIKKQNTVWIKREHIQFFHIDKEKEELKIGLTGGRAIILETKSPEIRAQELVPLQHLFNSRGTWEQEILKTLYRILNHL